MLKTWAIPELQLLFMTSGVSDSSRVYLIKAGLKPDGTKLPTTDFRVKILSEILSNLSSKGTWDDARELS